MTYLTLFHDSDIVFFTPFIYVFFYILVEKKYNKYPVVQSILTIISTIFGIIAIIYAVTIPSDILVLLPSRGGSKSYVSASIFLAIVGIAIATLPLYGKYIKLSNRIV